MSSPRRNAAVRPQIDAIVHGDLADGLPESLAAGAHLDGLSFGGVTVPLLSLAGATVRDCSFADVSAREADWKAVRLHETTFERLDVPVMRAARSVWRDVRVSGARLGSLETYEATWRSVHFVGCKLGFVNLRGAELLDVAFTDCVIDELDLTQCVSRRTAFSGTRANTLHLQGSRAEHLDLRGLEIQDIRGLDGLRGAIISSYQLSLLAPLLAREKGVRVEDLTEPIRAPRR